MDFAGGNQSRKFRDCVLRGNRTPGEVAQWVVSKKVANPLEKDRFVDLRTFCSRGINISDRKRTETHPTIPKKSGCGFRVKIVLQNGLNTAVIISVLNF